ncbi:FAD/NAD(P)-binding domain-containing protein [Pisolithus orientalis]|uniref:FAD/NAD(P)-binding domain-containing protein n=1 Tax=Pisolithus orientalis TaxID=936130 RepID=UPI002224F99F|nr:FAD/NAD(P)-binding domain-containing protein [Pisolithus orientalis]KAI6009541.1 FAD/NAD(P)-binding domain-containing protein [Pisolithus orientalis]
MSLPQNTTVLIVGAGPTGLASALSLIHHGFKDFVIVDAVVEGDNSSRAIVVHAATLEALDMIGCGDELVSKGTKMTSVNFDTQTGALSRLPFDSLEPYTRHPYALVIPQTFTEYVLGQKAADLGITVHRPHKVVGMKVSAVDTDLADITFEDGQVVTTRYVIAADGARSTIRTIAGIGFVDPKDSPEHDSTTLVQLVPADVTFDNPKLNISNLSGVMSANTYFFSVPLPFTFNEYLSRKTGKFIEDRIVRIACGVPVGEGPVPQAPSKAYIQNLIDKFDPLYLSSDPSANPSGKGVCIKEVIWSSRELLSSSLATAAHIHSPVGGQGMNLGLRDAVFLGEVLAKHVKVTESKPLSEADQILTDFAAERRTRALKVIGFTKSLLSVGGTKDAVVAWWLPISKVTLRDWVLWMVGKVYYLQRRVMWNFSGLGRR